MAQSMTFIQIGTLVGLAAALSAGLAVEPAWAASETRPLPPFSRIESSTGIDVTVNCGDVGRAVVMADPDSGLQRVKTEVEGQTLYLRVRGMGSWSGSIKVDVTSPTPIDHFESSSGSQMRVEGCALSPVSVYAATSSGATMRIEGGQTRSFEAHASSGSSLKAAELAADTGQLEATSGSSLRVCKVRNLTAHASSGASINVSPDASGKVEVSSGGNYSNRGC